MKRAIAVMLTFLMVPILFSGCVGNGSMIETPASEPIAVLDEHSETEAGSGNGGILIVYFSRVGNTDFGSDVDAVTSPTLNVIDGDFAGDSEIIANMVVDLTGGDLFFIQTVEPYSADFGETCDLALDEINTNTRPELSTHVENMDDYDTIILGYPNWWNTIPMPVVTFLEEYDFSGKTIVPFCTHRGRGLGRSISDIKKLCPDATILDGLAVRGPTVKKAQSTVEKWLNKLGLLG